jgi:hypothetical protein
MAIIITNAGFKTVDTIAERNSITKVFDGMQVTVVDAIADINVGIGEAGYQWSVAKAKWVLIWKESKDELVFSSESKVIVGGKVTADYLPSNSLVWSCSVRDSSNIIMMDIEPTIILKEINLGISNYDGLTLHYTYAHGMSEAISSVITCGKF